MSCRICAESQSVMHEHHTIPRSRGGDNSPLITLCSDCHNTLHANALAVVRRIRNPASKPLRSYWPTLQQEDTASPYLQILVKALLSPPVGDRQHLLSSSVPTSLFEEFKLLQTDLGLSSQEKTLEYCINYTLQHKGIKNVLSKDCKGQPDMWFLPVSSN